MHAVQMKKKESNKIVVPAPKRANFLPISVQISLQSQAKRHDKSRTRNKGKTWKKEWA